MQEDLPQGLVDELRKETCPQQVIDEAWRRIGATRTGRPTRTGQSARPSPRYVIPVALAGVVLLCGLLLARWRPAGGNARRQPELAEQQTYGRTQVPREVETALGLIGTALLDAGARSETVVSDRAIPHLQHGFDTAKEKIVRHTQL
jgi:hypothetical protein